MTDATETLRRASSLLLVDWPSPDVPESLVRAGLEVFVKGGPGPRDYARRELAAGEIVSRPLDGPPAHVDVLYAHRPLAELRGLAELAVGLGAAAVWWQTGLAGPETRDPRGCWASEEDAGKASESVRSAGLTFVYDAYIADAARGLAG